MLILPYPEQSLRHKRLQKAFRMQIPQIPKGVSLRCFRSKTGLQTASILCLEWNLRTVRKFKFMKNLILIALVVPLLTLSFTPTEDIKWENWNDGYSKAVKQKKIALVDCYTDWCGWCKRMDKDTYAKEDIAKKINKHFVPIKFNP